MTPHRLQSVGDGAGFLVADIRWIRSGTWIALVLPAPPSEDRTTMSKKKNQKKARKLTLSRKTLRRLDDDALGTVQGGAARMVSECSQCHCGGQSGGMTEL